ncbi:DUF2911 domain-containing protein [Spirosoma agri]|uniref:DUF2911 domain-containing protein n=1 Tax=Spirosoma agri TaxID=1987381 RepID=A0A6M0ICG9_9BACT|nr:DUF2911 domain-containing protein [Spirosoma agri]NEU65894.1 DUF2911 domain-containing protein [Spirosoma agri]
MKRVLFILAIIAAVLLVGLFALRSWTKSSSPETLVQLNQNGLNISVDYCQPRKKGRVIFGGLVPYGNVWRTGANEATVIKFDQPVLVAGQPLKAGEYTLWTIPSATSWVVIMNGETGQWGTNYDQTKDVLRVPVTSRKHSPVAEQFTINLVEQPGGADMLLTWDETEVVVPIRKQ